MKRPLLFAMAVGAVLAVVMTYPLAVRPGSVARFDTNDGKFSLWNVAWVAHSWLTDPTNVFHANIFHPHRYTLAYSEANLVAGTVGAPVYAITGNPIATHNVVVFIALVAAFMLTWQIVRRFTGSGVAGLISGTAYAFSAYVSAHTAHIQLLMVFVVPLAMLMMHRFVERPSIGRAVALGVTLAFGGLTCAYYGMAAGVGVGLGLVWFAWRHPEPRRYWMGALAAFVVTVVATLPAFVPYMALRRETGFKSALNLDEARYWSADWRAYSRSPALVYRPWNARPAAGGARDRDREVLFPGLIPLAGAIVCVAGLRSRRTLAPATPVRSANTAGSPVAGPRVIGFYAVVTLFFLWASFGPDAYLYTLLADVIPPMSFLRAPARWGVVTLFGLAVLAGIGIHRFARGRQWIVALLLVLVAVEHKAQWPLGEVPVVPEAYRRLATLPRGPVVEFHFPYRDTDLHNHAKFMYWSMWHWQPLVNGYSDYIPDDFREITAPINAFPDPDSFRILRDRQVRYVVLHLDTYNDAIRPDVLARYAAHAEYLRPLVQEGGVWLYEVVRYP